MEFHDTGSSIVTSCSWHSPLVLWWQKLLFSCPQQLSLTLESSRRVRSLSQHEKVTAVHTHAHTHTHTHTHMVAGHWQLAFWKMGKMVRMGKKEEGEKERKPWKTCQSNIALYFLYGYFLWLNTGFVIHLISVMWHLWVKQKCGVRLHLIH